MKRNFSIINRTIEHSPFFIKRLTCLLIVLIGLIIQIPVKAQSVITMSKAISSGLANKQDIIGKKQDISISHLQTIALYQKYLPQVSVEYQYLYNPILQTSILPIGLFNSTFPIDATKSVQFGTKWTQSAGVTVDLPVFDLSIKQHISEAKLNEQISAVAQAQSEYELAYIIAQTYIAIYLQESTNKSLIIDTNRTFISYTLLKNKFDQKRLLKSDVNKAKELHNNTVQSVADGIALLVEQKVYLLFLMGLKDPEKWNFEIDSTFFEKQSFQYTDSNVMINRSPDLLQLQLQSDLKNLEGKTEQTKYLPTIHFKGFLGANQFANTFNPIAANTWFGLSYIGLNVKLPILFGENHRNTMQQLKLQSNQYNLQEADKTLQYINEMYKIRIKMANIQAQLKTQEANIMLSSESIDIFQLRVKEGQAAALNLNLEEINLQLLKSNYETTNKQLWGHWLDYLKFSGQLTLLWQ